MTKKSAKVGSSGALGKKPARSTSSKAAAVQPVPRGPTKKRAATVKSAGHAQAADRSTTKASAPRVAPRNLTDASRALSGSLVGKKAPAFELLDQDGRQVRSESLLGKRYVLYFYPKDNTPGCTNEACAFRDDQPNFLKQKVTVLGVSPDSVKSHAGFAQKYNLPFTLLSDPEKSLANAYGVWAMKKNYGREYMGIVRSTFLVGKDGKIVREWRNVKVAGHAADILAEVGQ